MTRLLEPDRFHRETGPHLPGGRRRLYDRLVFGALLALSLLLFGVDRLGQPATALIRSTIEDATVPALRAATAWLSPLINSGRVVVEPQAIADERSRLRYENNRLKGWEARARTLERQVTALTELACVVEVPRLAFVTVRVVSSSGDHLCARRGSVQGARAVSRPVTRS